MDQVHGTGKNQIMKKKGRYYCEEQSSLYWEVYNEMNGIKTKKNKGPKKGKRASIRLPKEGFVYLGK